MANGLGRAEARDRDRSRSGRACGDRPRPRLSLVPGSDTIPVEQGGQRARAGFMRLWLGDGFLSTLRSGIVWSTHPPCLMWHGSSHFTEEGNAQGGVTCPAPPPGVTIRADPAEVTALVWGGRIRKMQ